MREEKFTFDHLVAAHLAVLTEEQRTGCSVDAPPIPPISFDILLLKEQYWHYEVERPCSEALFVLSLKQEDRGHKADCPQGLSFPPAPSAGLPNGRRREAQGRQPPLPTAFFRGLAKLLSAPFPHLLAHALAWDGAFWLWVAAERVG